MKKLRFTLAVTMVVLLGGCLRGCEDPIAAREVNDENCEKESIFAWAEEHDLRQEEMWEFTSKCSRRGNFKWSEDTVVNAMNKAS